MRIINIFLIVAVAVVLSGCSITQGSLNPSSHYVYPNSNVTPLGSTSAQVNKFGFIFPPRFRARDLDNLYGQALSKHQGADIIIDNKVDSKNTFLFLFHFMKVSLSGTAAKMEVGKQDIGQANFVPANTTQQTNQSTPADNSTQPVITTQQAVTTPVAQVQPEPEEPKAPRNPARLGLQANYISRDFIKPGIGFNTEFFLGQKFSISPSLNYFYPQRLDYGFGMGTYEAKQLAIYADAHYYVLDKVVGIYLLSTLSYEKTTISLGESDEGHSELGIGGGAGVSANLLSNRIIPFLEIKYVTLSSLSSGAYEYKPESNARLSWGLKFALGKKAE